MYTAKEFLKNVENNVRLIGTSLHGNFYNKCPKIKNNRIITLVYGKKKIGYVGWPKEFPEVGTTWAINVWILKKIIRYKTRKYFKEWMKKVESVMVDQFIHINYDSENYTFEITKEDIGISGN